MNILLRKKPGDGSIHKVREILEITGAPVFVINPVEGFEQSISDLRSQVQAHPDRAINLVADLWQAEDLEPWFNAVSPILESKSLAGMTLPEKTLVVLIVRDDPALNRSVAAKALGSRCHLVIDKLDVDTLTALKAKIEENLIKATGETSQRKHADPNPSPT
jgi:hypothetical protein